MPASRCGCLAREIALTVGTICATQQAAHTTFFFFYYDLVFIKIGIIKTTSGGWVYFYSVRITVESAAQRHSDVYRFSVLVVVVNSIFLFNFVFAKSNEKNNLVNW